MEVTNIPLIQIKPYWRNARKNDKTVEAVKQSIKDYGFNQPLVLDKHNVIITGHARFKALMQLGYKDAPCVVLDLPENKAKEYRIADNKTHEMTIWDNEQLVVELREIGNFESMQDYFQNINLTDWLDDSVGFNLNPITQEKVEKAQTTLEEKYSAENTTEDTVDVMCPHCYEEFEIKKSELL
tara:strand:- start:308 stop:856 length:549 start_codon:yes stop_codon:yes gene_type:complete